ncbi:hypothetical protein FRC03_011133 [Tulasnella sp. 419]|nr:hypothetical protein FRC03_011133 [Tulasnella sp. 419]
MAQSFLDDQLLVPAHRHRLEHAQILTQDDLKRVGKLGSMFGNDNRPEAFITKDYNSQSSPAFSLLTQLVICPMLNIGFHNVTLALGSDFPVEGINPLLGFYAAVTRLDTEGNSPHGPGGWFPEQRLTRIEALRGMTLGPAFASFQEDTLGSLTVGKRADIVILDRDIMQVPAGEILKAKVKATIVDGQLAYGKV